MTINRLMARLVEELRANAVPEPLTQGFLLAATWDDLCRLAGEEAPAGVRALLGNEIAPSRLARRGQETGTPDRDWASPSSRPDGDPKSL